MVRQQAMLKAKPIMFIEENTLFFQIFLHAILKLNHIISCSFKLSAIAVSRFMIKLLEKSFFVFLNFNKLSAIS